MSSGLSCVDLEEGERRFLRLSGTGNEFDWLIYYLYRIRRKNVFGRNVQRRGTFHFETYRN